MCGPSDGKEVKDVFGRPGAHVGVGSAHIRPLAAHGVGSLAAGLNLETGQLSRHYIAEISLNVTLNHNQPTNSCISCAYMFESSVGLLALKLAVNLGKYKRIIFIFDLHVHSTQSFLVRFDIIGLMILTEYV